MDFAHPNVSFVDVDKTLAGNPEKTHPADEFIMCMFAQWLVRKKLFPESNYEGLRKQMELMASKQKGYEEGATEMVRLWAQGLEGNSVRRIEAEGRRFIQKTFGRTRPGQLRLWPHSKSLMELLGRSGVTVLLSASPREAIEPLARFVGAHHAIATTV